MSEASIRDLRHRGGEIVERAAGGEVVTITRDGAPVAELRALPARPLAAGPLLERWRTLPPVDPQALRDDLDAILDPRL
jgi:antitoxin (DNA-binding transcriptional repressor) of toxin-antitoxin stability system